MNAKTRNKEDTRLRKHTDMQDCNVADLRAHSWLFKQHKACLGQNLVEWLFKSIILSSCFNWALRMCQAHRASPCTTVIILLANHLAGPSLSLLCSPGPQGLLMLTCWSGGGGA